MFWFNTKPNKKITQKRQILSGKTWLGPKTNMVEKSNNPKIWYTREIKTITVEFKGSSQWKSFLLFDEKQRCFSCTLHLQGEPSRLRRPAECAGAAAAEQKSWLWTIAFQNKSISGRRRHQPIGWCMRESQRWVRSFAELDLNTRLFGLEGDSLICWGLCLVKEAAVAWNGR